jgi:calcineurin-like phosphoesterase family protein
MSRAKTWVVADTHFGHQLMTTLRPWDTIEEHDEALIDNWNGVVGETDRVYVLGDVAMNRRHLPTIGRCNGKKVLVKGNHDIFKLKDYLPFFDDIRAYVVKPKIGVILSHIPIHPQSLERWKLNVHGHLHEHHVQHDLRIDDTGRGVLRGGYDTRYKRVSLEQINYTPILLDSLIP